MVSLNDYLYSGDTVLRILHNYIKDLRKDAKMTGNEIDMIHCNFLLQIQELLEHNTWHRNIRLWHLLSREGSSH